MQNRSFGRRETIYPLDEWKIIETSYQENNHQRGETIFALGNGYLGMRGNFEEGFYGFAGRSVQGTYINGFYESEPIHYPEGAYGYARKSQTMLNVADVKDVAVFVDGERFSLFSGKVHQYERELDMRTGVLTRTVVWESPAGRRVRIGFRRVVCLARKHLAAFEIAVSSLNGKADVVFESAIDGEVRNEGAQDDPRVGDTMREQALVMEDLGFTGNRAWLRQTTRNTGFRLLAAIDHQLQVNSSVCTETVTGKQRIAVRYVVVVKENEQVVLHKYAAYHTSKDDPEDELATLADKTLREAAKLGFAAILQEQAGYLREYWRRADVRIDGDAALQQGMRYNAFQLLQATGKDGRTNIGAKGLTGEGYEGHYFWDTETFVLPFFLYTSPEISRSLLMFRANTLDQARQRAREMSQRGALYPWRTINGEETSAYYPAGTAQAHINADIMHALKKYVEATGDEAFLRHDGAEMLFETARFWADLGHFNPRRQGRFCIDAVTGPDEYTAVVNNNAYTNLMAQDHLAFACRTARWMMANHAEDYRRLADRIGLKDEEIAEWQQAADLMFVPYDDEYGIMAQDDSFLMKEKWDFVGTPDEKYPLLLHFHPLVIYRHQVLKQADIVLAMFLLSGKFSLAEKIRNYDYYEALTTHDSSLSPCIHSIIAAEIGCLEQAYEYFNRTVRMDLDDINGNAADGLHMAAMAGARLSLVNGFAGMRDEDGKLRFNPTIPKTWRSYSFSMVYQGRLLDVHITPQKAVYRLAEGAPLSIGHAYSELRLKTGAAVEVSLTAKLEAVIFDLDGVIVNTAEHHYQAWKKLADELRLPFDRTVNERLKGVSRMASLEIILEHGTLALTPEEKAELAARKNCVYASLIEQITPEHMLPGINNLLRELREAGIRIGLASASHNARTILRKLQIEEAFDVVVDPTTLKKGKPDPEIFIEAAALLKAKPGNCIGVEDAKAGIDAIRAAGMMAVGVGDAKRLERADFVVADTSSLTLTQLRVWFDASR